MDDSFEAKLQAVACYRSQLPVIFRFTADFRGALRAHALDAGRGQALCERFWPVLS